MVSSTLMVHRSLPSGQLAAALVRRLPVVSLDWDQRSKSRLQAVDSLGRTLGVVLPRGSVLRDNAVLVAEDGSMVRVVAADQPLLRVSTCPAHGSPFDLVRAAYHLGNRHVPLELTPQHLQLEPDAVLADMLRAMHLIVREVQAPFEPEGGAYGGDHGGVHGAAAAVHGHGHGHEQHHHPHHHG